MNPRTDIQTLELAPRLDVTAALAGGVLEVGGVKVHLFLRGAAVLATWTRSRSQHRRQRLQLASFTPGLGGVVRLFLCDCGRQVRSVFLAQDASAWACRWCLGLRYRSQRIRYPSRG